MNSKLKDIRRVIVNEIIEDLSNGSKIPGRRMRAKARTINLPKSKIKHIHPIVTARAAEWGVDIVVSDAEKERYGKQQLGFYCSEKRAKFDSSRKIVLYNTTEPSTVFCLLAYAALDLHQRKDRRRKRPGHGRSSGIKEIVADEIAADLSAFVLCLYLDFYDRRIFGYAYVSLINHFAKIPSSKFLVYVIIILRKTEAIVDMILGDEQR